MILLISTDCGRAGVMCCQYGAITVTVVSYSCVNMTNSRTSGRPAATRVYLSDL